MTTIQGDCLDVLRGLAAESHDSLVTDPPAGISFMGKGWDGDKGGRAQWIAWLTEVMAECHRVLKPGAHALVWAIPRTSHWTMTALEDAGFEIRDVVTHLFGTGFPKSMDVSKAIDKEAGAERTPIGPGKWNSRKVNGSASEHSAGLSTRPDFQETAPSTDSARQWDGWGTALKPACEFWVLCRKPISENTVAKNILKHGTGGLNIDGCRIDGKPRTTHADGNFRTRNSGPTMNEGLGLGAYAAATGRFPSNLVLDEEAAQALDEQSGTLVSKWGKQKTRHDGDASMFGLGVPEDVNKYSGDSGGASRFFYVAKASKSDRGEGNSHPTVKSTKLMAYLVRLITPPGGTVLDPFMGSGSTGVAASREGFGFTGIEQDSQSFDIARGRLANG